MSVPPSFSYDPHSADYIENPYPTFAQLHREGPIHWSPRTGEWLVSGHSAVRAILKDPSFNSPNFSRVLANLRGNDPRPLNALEDLARAMIVLPDPETHAAMRRTLARVINRRPAESFAAVTKSISNGLFGKIRENGGGDLVADFAALLPLHVIGRMLGTPESDLPYLRECCRDTLALVTNRQITPEPFFEFNSRVAEGLDYLQSTLAERRASPRDDGLTSLVQLGDEQGTPDRVMAAQAYAIFLAGVDTTANFIGSGLNLLLDHPAELTRLASGSVTADGATRELVRMTTPVRIATREATASWPVGGCTIEPGQRACLLLGAANRDPVVFAEPDRLDLGRVPQPHVAFSEGAHACLGMMYATMEGTAAFTAFARLPAMTRLAPTSWEAHEALCGPKAILVRC